MVLPVGGRKPGIPDRTGFELNTSVSALQAFQQVFAYNIYDPADPQYGAVRSATDPGTSIKAANTVAIQAAADDARDNNGILVIKGTYWVSGEIQVQSHMDGSAGSLQVNDRNIACVMLVGSRSERTSNKHIIVPEIYQNDMPLGFVGTGVGLEVANTYTCHITTTNIRGFRVNMWVSAYGNGNVYNTYYLGQLHNGKTNLLLMPETGGWCNENLFIGGRLLHNQNEGENVPGVRQIQLDGNGVYGPDNNVFVKPSIEGSTPEYHLEIIEGRDNRVIHGRWETASGNPRVHYSGARATHNIIDHGYNVEDIEYTQTDTVGGNLHVDWTGTRFIGTNVNAITKYGSNQLIVRGTAPSRLINTGSNNNPALIILPLGSTGSTDDSAYGAHYGVQRTRWKDTADASPRIEVRNNIGQIWFGNGTDAVDVSLRQTATNTLGTGAGDNFYVGGGLEVDGALDHDGSTVGFYGTTPISKPSVTGATDSDKITSLITALSNLGLITDSTT